MQNLGYGDCEYMCRVKICVCNCLLLRRFSARGVVAPSDDIHEDIAQFCLGNALPDQASAHRISTFCAYIQHWCCTTFCCDWITMLSKEPWSLVKRVVPVGRAPFGYSGGSGVGRTVATRRCFPALLICLYTANYISLFWINLAGFWISIWTTGD